MNLLPASNKTLLIGLALWGGMLGCAGPRAVGSSPEEGEIPVVPPSFPLKVAVAVFEDLRPPEDRDMEARKLLGDSRYPYYTYDEEPVITPRACGFMGLCAVYIPQPISMTSVLSKRLVERLKAAHLFADVEPFPETLALATFKRLKAFRDDGFDAVLTGKLARWYGLSYPFFSGQFYTVFTGTVEYPKQIKTIALIRLDQIQLISLETGQVLVSLELEYAIDRKERRTTARKVANEALEGAMDRLLEQLSKALETSP